MRIRYEIRTVSVSHEIIVTDGAEQPEVLQEQLHGFSQSQLPAPSQEVGNNLIHVQDERPFLIRLLDLLQNR